MTQQSLKSYGNSNVVKLFPKSIPRNVIEEIDCQRRSDSLDAEIIKFSSLYEQRTQYWLHHFDEFLQRIATDYIDRLSALGASVPYPVVRKNVHNIGMPIDVPLYNSQIGIIEYGISLEKEVIKEAKKENMLLWRRMSKKMRSPLAKKIIFDYHPEFVHIEYAEDKMAKFASFCDVVGNWLYSSLYEEGDRGSPFFQHMRYIYLPSYDKTEYRCTAILSDCLKDKSMPEALSLLSEIYGEDVLKRSFQ